MQYGKWAMPDLQVVEPDGKEWDDDYGDAWEDFSGHSQWKTGVGDAHKAWSKAKLQSVALIDSLFNLKALLPKIQATPSEIPADLRKKLSVLHKGLDLNLKQPYFKAFYEGWEDYERGIRAWKQGSGHQSTTVFPPAGGFVDPFAAPKDNLAHLEKALPKTMLLAKEFNDLWGKALSAIERALNIPNTPSRQELSDSGKDPNTALLNEPRWVARGQAFVATEAFLDKAVEFFKHVALVQDLVEFFRDPPRKKLWDHMGSPNPLHRLAEAAGLHFPKPLGS